MTRKVKKQRSGFHSPPPPQGNKWWNQWPGFTPKPNRSMANEFKRLAHHMKWSKDDRKTYWAEACETEFGHHFEDKKTTLESWQSLCREVSIDPAPESITKCRKALDHVLVNLVNLMDHRRNRSVQLISFPTFTKFRKYTEAGRTFPRELAKEEGFIKDLLRHLGSRHG